MSRPADSRRHGALAVAAGAVGLALALAVPAGASTDPPRTESWSPELAVDGGDDRGVVLDDGAIRLDDTGESDGELVLAPRRTTGVVDSVAGVPTADVPDGGSLVVEARGLRGDGRWGSWVTVPRDGTARLGGPSTELSVRVLLRRADDGASPVLRALWLTTTAVPAPVTTETRTETRTATRTKTVTPEPTTTSAEPTTTTTAEPTTTTTTPRPTTTTTTPRPTTTTVEPTTTTPRPTTTTPRPTTTTPRPTTEPPTTEPTTTEPTTSTTTSTGTEESRPGRPSKPADDPTRTATGTTTTTTTTTSPVVPPGLLTGLPGLPGPRPAPLPPATAVNDAGSSWGQDLLDWLGRAF